MTTNITVYLTTTKWTQAADTISVDRIQQLNVPVCVTKMSIMLFGGSNVGGPFGNEAIENSWAETSLKMAKYVIIKPKHKFLYIGTNPNARPKDKTNERDGLVTFIEKKNEENQQVNDFFERWLVTKMLMFEYIVYNNKNEPRFCLKGIWNTNCWQHLEIKPANSLYIISPDS